MLHAFFEAEAGGRVRVRHSDSARVRRSVARVRAAIVGNWSDDGGEKFVSVGSRALRIGGHGTEPDGMCRMKHIVTVPMPAVRNMNEKPKRKSRNVKREADQPGVR